MFIFIGGSFTLWTPPMPIFGGVRTPRPPRESTRLESAFARLECKFQVNSMNPHSRQSTRLEYVNADFFAKAGVSLPTDAVPRPLPTFIAKIRYLQYHNCRRHISLSYPNHQVPKVSSKELHFCCPIPSKLSPSSLPWPQSSLLQDQSEGEFCL